MVDELSLEERLAEIDNKIYEKQSEIGKLQMERIRIKNAIFARDWNVQHGWSE